jgi:hypothetical protein
MSTNTGTTQYSAHTLQWLLNDCLHLTTRKELKIVQATMAQSTKPCPQCHAPVERAGGCNHIKCLRCGDSFCWICGLAVDEVSWY